MVEPKRADIIILECHPGIWWLHTILFLAATVLMIYVVCAMSPPTLIIVMAMGFSIFCFYGIISLPRKIVANSSSVIVIWPWFTWRISTEKIIKIIVTPYRIKCVFITIVRKKSFFNMPLMFTWSLKSGDYEKMLTDIVKRFEVIRIKDKG